MNRTTNELRARFDAWADGNGYGPKFRESMFAAFEAGFALAASQGPPKAEREDRIRAAMDRYEAAADEPASYVGMEAALELDPESASKSVQGDAVPAIAGESNDGHAE